MVAIPNGKIRHLLNSSKSMQVQNLLINFNFSFYQPFKHIFLL